MNQSQHDPAIIVALDVPSHEEAIILAKKLDPKLCRVKVGLELFTAAGPAVVEALHEIGFEVFLDLKFKDIPNTVAGAVRSACELGVWMLNVHADGGPKMLVAAVDAVKNTARPPLIIGVTVLTSMDYSDLREVGVRTPKNSTLPQVIKLAKLAKKCGLDGLVCSGQEALEVRRRIDQDFLILTPGIRLPEGSKNDQERVTTPEQAVYAGANYLVIGRPITGARDTLAALEDFNNRVCLAQENARTLNQNQGGE